MSRAITEEELRDMIVGHVKAMADYWASLPDVDKATGDPITIKDRCDGVAFSILAMLDGSSMDLPAFDLVAQPHPDDKEYLQSEGSDWIEPGTTINYALHEYYHKS